MNKKIKNQLKKGITLVELIVIIAVVAIIATFVVPRISGVTDAAEVAKVTNDVAACNAAIENFIGAGGVWAPADEAAALTALASLSVNNMDFSPATVPAAADVDVTGSGATLRFVVP